MFLFLEYFYINKVIKLSRFSLQFIQILFIRKNYNKMDK